MAGFIILPHFMPTQMSVNDSAQSDSDKAQGHAGNITLVTLPGRHTFGIRHVKYDDSLFFVRVLFKIHP
ncbi:TPA: hypothetical protein F6U11_05070 [Citrobacter freundii]|nr:hypothetical protein [Citrobacter freundii]